MTATTTPTDPKTDPTTDPTPDPAGSTDPAPDPKPAGGEPAKVTMTQAELDALIGRAHGKAKTQAEKELKAFLEAEGLSETEKLKAAATQADERVAAAQREVLVTKIETAAERAALAAGVKPERVERFMRLVDLDPDDVTDDGKPDPDAIRKAIDKVLGEVPEFKGEPAPTGAAGGEHTGGGGKQWTRSEIAELAKNPAEFAKHEAEIDAQVKAGTVK
jgi:hypothetical protein